MTSTGGKPSVDVHRYQRKVSKESVKEWHSEETPSNYDEKPARNQNHMGD